MCEGLTDKKSSATTDSCRQCRGCAFEVSGKTEESLVRWGAVSKFSEGRSRFYPGFSKTENIRIVGVDEILNGGAGEEVNGYSECRQ